MLPLVSQSGSPDSGWLSTGIPEMIAQGLAENPELQVANSLRVLRTFEDLHLDPSAWVRRELQRLGELLDVDRLVSGTVREAGGIVRVDCGWPTGTCPTTGHGDPSGGPASESSSSRTSSPQTSRTALAAATCATGPTLAVGGRRGHGGLREGLDLTAGRRTAAAGRHSNRRWP